MLRNIHSDILSTIASSASLTVHAALLAPHVRGSGDRYGVTALGPYCERMGNLEDDLNRAETLVYAR